MIVSHFVSICPCLPQQDDFQSFCKSLDWEDHAESLAATLVVPANVNKMNYPILVNPSNLLTNNKPVLKTNNTPCEVGMATSPRVVHSHGVSPLPRLNHFITNNLGKRDGHDGTINTWHLDMQEKVIQYCMKGDRFCENIGRQHKSNNIIWNCDLLSKMYWQSCFDPECKGFRGKCRHLPENIDSEIDAFIK